MCLTPALYRLSKIYLNIINIFRADQQPDPIEQEIPDICPSCAITRAMAKKVKQNNGMHDINLADTLISQSFNDEISNSLSPSKSDIQTEFDTPRSNTDLS